MRKKNSIRYSFTVITITQCDRFLSLLKFWRTQIFFLSSTCSQSPQSLQVIDFCLRTVHDMQKGPLTWYAHTVVKITKCDHFISLSQSMSYAKASLLWYALIVVMITFGFSAGFYTGYGVEEAQYSTLNSALLSLTELLFGKNSALSSTHVTHSARSGGCDAQPSILIYHPAPRFCRS